MNGQIQSWWDGLSPELRAQAREIAAQPAPRALRVDALTASMMQAGLPTSRPVWTGQPEALLEMDADVAAFVDAQTEL